MSTQLKPTKAEIAATLADRDYWRSVGALLGVKLYAFTDRYAADFYDVHGEASQREMVAIPGWLANRIIALAKK
jgi:hypothetical protein